MFKKTIAISSVVIGLALVVTVFAQTGNTTATTATDATVTKIACVGTAVVAREASLDAGMTAYTGAVNGAYSARATALASAYSQTTASAVKAGR